MNKESKLEVRTISGRIYLADAKNTGKGRTLLSELIPLDPSKEVQGFTATVDRGTFVFRVYKSEEGAEMPFNFDVKAIGDASVVVPEINMLSKKHVRAALSNDGSPSGYLVRGELPKKFRERLKGNGKTKFFVSQQFGEKEFPFLIASSSGQVKSVFDIFGSYPGSILPVRNDREDSTMVFKHLCVKKEPSNLPGYKYCLNMFVPRAKRKKFTTARGPEQGPSAAIYLYFNAEVTDDGEFIPAPASEWLVKYNREKVQVAENSQMLNTDDQIRLLATQSMWDRAVAGVSCPQPTSVTATEEIEDSPSDLHSDISEEG